MVLLSFNFDNRQATFWFSFQNKFLTTNKHFLHQALRNKNNWQHFVLIQIQATLKHELYQIFELILVHWAWLFKPIWRSQIWSLLPIIGKLFYNNPQIHCWLSFFAEIKTKKLRRDVPSPKSEYQLTSLLLHQTMLSVCCSVFCSGQISCWSGSI